MKKSIRLVSISFPGRDLNLAPVSLKCFALKDERIAKEYTIHISQFEIPTSNDEIYNDLVGRGEELYGFTTYVWNIKKILEIAKRLKKGNSNTIIVLGGPEASGMATKLLLQYDFIDFIFVGEGEVAFRAFLTSTNLRKVPGLVYRANGTIIFNPETVLKDLDALALPYESEDYRNFLDTSSSPVRAAIETSRGCPFSCRYCTWGTRTMRYFSLEKLKPAFKYLLKHPNVATVYITDSNPFLRKKRARKLLNFLIEHNFDKKPITFELNPEYMTDEKLMGLITQLKNEEFAFGVQSTAPQVLQKIGRRFDAELYRKNINLIKKNNPKVRLWFSLIIGLPGDNYEQFLESMDFVLNLKPEGIYFHELLCLPGSEFYKNPEKYGIEYMEEAPHKVLWNDTFPHEEYNRAKSLGYHVYLIHRVAHLREDISALSHTQSGLKLVDFYSRFVEFIDGKLDTLLGKTIQDISSWFFEQLANDFLKDPRNIIRLESLYKTFKRRYNHGREL
ncbi:MAG: B12-binding domain-containing radical SAM protein [Candidatus Heimdallarchaeota archaeon]